MGADLRNNPPNGANDQLKKLATVAGFSLDDFWRELAIWMRRVFQMTFDWKNELRREPKKLPMTLFYTKDASTLIQEFDGENDLEVQEIPALMEDPNSGASTWLILKTDPVYLALVQLEDVPEDLEYQR